MCEIGIDVVSLEHEHRWQLQDLSTNTNWYMYQLLYESYTSFYMNPPILVSAHFRSWIKTAFPTLHNLTKHKIVGRQIVVITGALSNNSSINGVTVIARCQNMLSLMINNVIVLYNVSATNHDDNDFIINKILSRIIWLFLIV
jgi:hypothetical protein